jgi:hypothetical protein
MHGPVDIKTETSFTRAMEQNVYKYNSKSTLEEL